MSFSKEWDNIYRAGEQNSIWPWSDLISLTNHYLKGKKEGKKVLELGCGAGANIPFFLSLGMEYYAIEGSRYQTEILNKNFKSDNVHIINADFTKEIPFECSFDLIIDRCSITCNCISDIKKILDMIYEKLIVGGYFIGVDWLSDNHSALNQEEEEIEFIGEKTCKFHKGYFSGLGALQFFDYEQINILFNKFLIVELYEKKIIYHIPDSNINAFWNLVAKRL